MGRPTSSQTRTATTGAGRGTARVPGPTNPAGNGPAPDALLAKFPELRPLGITVDEARTLNKKPDLWSDIITGVVTSTHLRESREEKLQAALEREPMLHPDLAGMDSPFYDYYYPEEGEPEQDPLSLPFHDALGTLLQIYDRLCRYEYERIASDLKPAFEGMSKEFKVSPPWRYYQTLRPGYRKESPDDPIAPINEVRPKLEFLGKTVWLGGHPDLAERLNRVEVWLREKGAYDEVRNALKQPHLGGFVPRVIAGTTSLSNHALGRAIDIDAVTNPMLHGEGGKAIDAILDYLDGKGIKCTGRVRTSFAGFADYS
ncbi:MAG: M15 family metallopeptidase, partial [Candidatus Eisenbacteria bacterium]|nr:M15 family metallopeptidase [Candidatus Eisenbacteria bacterium]